jgi:hypothetical protein
MKSYKLKLALQEPTTVGAQRMIGNQAPSLDYIPATVLRGALAAALLRKGQKTRLAPLFGGASPRWCPAWPCSSEHGEIVVPMPLSYLRGKGDDGFEGALGVINILRTKRPDDADTYKRLFGTDLPGDMDKLQWVGMAPGWLTFTLTDNTILSAGAISPKFGNAMFHGADYLMGTARDGWLYSREAITEFQTFSAHVMDEEEVIGEGDKLDEVLLGKRITGGNGLATVGWEDVRDLPPWATCAPEGEEDVTIQIMSPTILPARNGGFLTGIDAGAWSALLGVAIEVKSAQSDTTTVQGWITSWDLPRERYPAVAPGSCYHLRLRNTCDKPQFHSALKLLVEKGLGIRTGEGFGWVAVSPPWLDPLFFSGSPASDATFRPDTLPETKGLLRNEKRNLISHAYTFTDAPKVKEKTAELAAIADRVTSTAALESYLEGLAGRTNPRNWDKVNDAWQAHGKPYVDDDPEAMRYFLSWAKTFAVNID